ncbi:BC1872 family protein [Bacillus toyonensis]|uniref:Phage ABA sandwich domain-containing protein n=1 Tax=Bacillus toyonensis TaxID=155322 RepID=A0A2C4Q9X3_9BACI|nr:hypothetical protein [Bacillus toyonensis]PGA92160.1 hypothetical protein COL93_26530 [Bacillus toyonensis]PHD61243.1 hypothetical protein COF40_26570 [Bacillus toyonensis]
MNNNSINQLIAEKVMGWHLRKLENVDAWIDGQGNWTLKQMWKHTTNIQDAWLVFEKFDFANVERVTGYGDFYKVNLSVPEIDGTYSEVEIKSTTAPMAICMAALKSIGEAI